MSLAHDLLEQAEHLVKRERGRPKQASLRRAISTAYYALFHLLLEEAALQIVPGNLVAWRPVASRTINHGDLRKVATWFASGALPLPLVLSNPLSADIRLVAMVCNQLQQRRHEADYDTTARLKRGQVQQQVRRAEQAFAAWSRVRSSEEGRAFLLLLLVTDRWKR